MTKEPNEMPTIALTSNKKLLRHILFVAFVTIIINVAFLYQINFFEDQGVYEDSDPRGLIPGPNVLIKKSKAKRPSRRQDLLSSKFKKENHLGKQGSLSSESKGVNHSVGATNNVKDEKEKKQTTQLKISTKKIHSKENSNDMKISNKNGDKTQFKISTKKIHSKEKSNDIKISNKNNNNIRQGRGRILQMLFNAKVPLLNDTMIQKLPTEDDISRLYGPKPIIYYSYSLNNLGDMKEINKDACSAYQENVPPLERMVGAAGMFNSGTNLITHLMKNNCRIPERYKAKPDGSREDHGMRWQVPWGKHTPAKYKYSHKAEHAGAINSNYIMPLVMIRHPYSWLKSTCKNRYTVNWNHGSRCPNLTKMNTYTHSKEYMGATVKYSGDRIDKHKSVAHLWNDWYQQYYYQTKFLESEEKQVEENVEHDNLYDKNNKNHYPRLIIRIEDIVYYAEETISSVCECVGGEIRTDRPFVYITDSAKNDSPGHDATTGMLTAIMKYAAPYEDMLSYTADGKSKNKGGFIDQEDHESLKEVLSKEMMNTFHYIHPPTRA